MTNGNTKIIGVGGYARAGKDLYCKIASSLLKDRGINSVKLAFADELKKEIDPMLKSLVNISAFTTDVKEKDLIRPALVWLGCSRRTLSPGGMYWVEKVDKIITHYVKTRTNLSLMQPLIILISDVRFPNEADWLRTKWNGWFVHLRKYKIEHVVCDFGRPNGGDVMVFDPPPNDEEAKNDPLIREKADYKLDWEQIGLKEGQPMDDLIENRYLRKCVEDSMEGVLNDVIISNTISKQLEISSVCV
jgi:hypothetical protein